MGLTNTDKKEIEILIRKEIKDFIGSNTVKQFEDKLITYISDEIKKGKLEKDMKEVIRKAFSSFYNFMWVNRHYWETRI